MICPTCGARIRDDALICPSCRSAVDVTRKLTLSGAQWCPSCGALMAPDAEVCPKCGLSVHRELPARAVRDISLPEIGNTGMMDALDDDDFVTQLESAIPPEDDAEFSTVRRDHMPRPRAFAFAALFAVLVVGGAALLITHPWDPTATQTRAKDPADTSMSGFPGFVESLSGQDTGPGGLVDSADPAEALTAAHEELGKLSERAGESEQSLRGEGLTGNRAQRQTGLDRAEDLALEVSELISSISAYQDGDEGYAESAGELVSLANVLKSRCDALVRSWGLAVESEDPASESAAILAPVEGVADSVSRLEEGLAAWSLN